jgi:hypothetical protein
VETGKGWFNIRESDWGVYQISKLKKFMELMKFSMQVTLAQKSHSCAKKANKDPIFLLFILGLAQISCTRLAGQLYSNDYRQLLASHRYKTGLFLARKRHNQQ